MIKTRLVLAVLAACAALARPRRLRRWRRASSSSDPASVAPPESPLFIEATLRPSGDAEDERRSAGEEASPGSTTSAGRSSPELESSALRRGSSTTPKTSSPGWAKRPASSSRNTTATTSPATAIALAGTDTGATQDFIDKRRRRATSRSKTAPTKGSTTRSTATTKPRSAWSATSSSSPRTEAAFKDAVDASDGESLADERLLHDAIADAPEDSLVDVYVDIGGLIEAGGRRRRPADRSRCSKRRDRTRRSDRPARAWCPAPTASRSTWPATLGGCERRAATPPRRCSIRLPADSVAAVGAAEFGKQLAGRRSTRSTPTGIPGRCRRTS